jgi:hypothetical protein
VEPLQTVPTYQIGHGSGSPDRIEHLGVRPQEPGQCGRVPELATTIVKVAAVFSMTDQSDPPGKPHRNGTSLEEARLRQQAIGVRLRHLFDEVVNEPVPDEFLDILRRVDERSSDEVDG